jgi:hypothetical protein
MKIVRQLVTPQYDFILTLNQREYQALRFCIDYCGHRAKKHISPVTQYKDFIEEMKLKFI